MSQYFDRHETRSPQSREVALMRDLRAIIAMAKPRAAGLRRQTKGIDLADIKTRADLARIPVLRETDLLKWQADEPPFGGFVATRLGALKRLIVSADSRFEPESHAKDWWGAARALCAAGIGRNDVILNCFSYHLACEGFIMESGANALNCAVIPAGTADLDLQIEAIRGMQPTAYCGPADFLLSLAEHARERGASIASIERALVAGPLLKPHLRCDLESRGIRVRQAYFIPHLGIIAYESEGPDGELGDGMIVNEGLILEIVTPGTGDPVRIGEIGEIVVTRLNPDYPLLRFGTGQLSALLPGVSPCGRTNLRLKGYLGRVNQTADRSHADERIRQSPVLNCRDAANAVIDAQRGAFGRPNDDRRI
jgi:phenylacetate-CoA ligase